MRIAPHHIAHSSVDCTDVQIQEPAPFDKKWFSHKTRSATLRYEVRLSLEGYLVWVNVPYPAGQYSDLVILKKSLRNMLLPNECVVADGIYADVKCTYETADSAITASRIRARQESLFPRFKSLG